MEELITAINELAKTPHIEYWNLGITTILTGYIIWQTNKNNKKINNLTKENTNKQIDLALLDKRLNVYDTYVKAGIFLTSESFHEFIEICPSTEHASNKLIAMYEQEGKLISALNQAKLLFNDKELINCLKLIRTKYTDYLRAFNKMMIFIKELDKVTKKEPNEIKKAYEEIKQLKDSDLDIIGNQILEILEDDNFDSMFKKYIIIEKMN